jgi:integrase
MLTDLKIDRLKATSKPMRFADRDGLTLEVRPSGKKMFLFRFQWDKKPQTITLGRYPSLRLAEARKKALEHRVSLNRGIDPRRGTEPSVKEKSAFKGIAEQWFIKNTPSWRDTTRYKHNRSLERDIYPVIGTMSIHDISKADLLQVFQPHEALGHHEIVHRLHDRIKAVFDYAQSAGLTENYPFLGLKNAITAKPKIKNQVAIPATEAHEMLTAIRDSDAGDIIKLYIEILAHLFVRPSELRLAQWSEFDLQQGAWNIPCDRMKMDAPHWVPLTPEVIRLLKRLRLITGFTPYLFVSINNKDKKPISETSARKWLHKLGYRGRHTLHGCRALASTVLHEQSSFRTDAIEAQLAHKVQGVRGVYLRADFKQERRELMEWYTRWLGGETVSRGYGVSAQGN